jgi:hypothetical protein
MKNIGKIAGLLVLMTVVLTGCYKYNDTIYLDELDVTITYYEEGFDFQPYTTFVIRDSVGFITNYLEDEDEEEFYKPGGASEQIRNYVTQKFTSMGYTLVDEDENFDFGVNLTASFINTTTIVGYPGWWGGWYDYWGWYGGYWPPYYGGWYPWYTSVYQHQTGSIMIEMADGESVREYREFIDGKTDEELEQIPPEDFPPINFRWQGMVQGVLGTSTDYNKDRAQRGIDEAFDQSPYLKKN